MTLPVADCHVCVCLSAAPQGVTLYGGLVQQLGTAIGARGWRLVWGGQRSGAMGLLAGAVRASGGTTSGIIPRSLIAEADPAADFLRVTGSLDERKQVMQAASDATLVLPGGLGTCDELLSAWTARLTGLHNKPLVLLDPEAHYGGWLQWFEELADNGFVRPPVLDLVTVTATVHEALDACVRLHHDSAVQTAAPPAPRTGPSRPMPYKPAS